MGSLFINTPQSSLQELTALTNDRTEWGAMVRQTLPIAKQMTQPAKNNKCEKEKPEVSETGGWVVVPERYGLETQ